MCLNVANGKIIGGCTHEAIVGMEFREPDRLNQRDLAKRTVLPGHFYVAAISYIGYDFMVRNTIGPLPHLATLVREDKRHVAWLATNYAPRLSPWPAEQEYKMVRGV